MKNVIRMAEDRKPRQIIEERLEGRKLEEDQDKFIMDGIEKIARKNEAIVTGLMKTTGDRKDRKRWVEVVPTL